MKTLNFKGDRRDYDPAQVFTVGRKAYTVNHAVYDESADRTKLFLKEYSGTFVGSRGTMGTTEKGRI